jgi:hypothetical protein
MHSYYDSSLTQSGFNWHADEWMIKNSIRSRNHMTQHGTHLQIV